MTTVEFKYRFNVKLEADANLAPGFTDSEISEYLKMSEKSIIDEYIKNKDYHSIHTLIKESLLTLTLDSTYTPQSIHTFDLPADFYTEIEVKLKNERKFPVTDSSGNFRLGWYPCKRINSEDMSKFFKNTHINDTIYFKEPKFIIGTNLKGNILQDAYSQIPNLSNCLSLKYIKKPVSINIGTSTTSELPELLHNNIVNLAVELAIKSTLVTKLQQ